MGEADAEGKFVKQTGGRGQYGHVKLKIEPLERDAGFEFVNAVKGGNIPREFISSCEKGIVNTLDTGILAGYPVVDVRVTVYDGSYHPVDSSDVAFQMAASYAFKDAFKNADPVILEPIMDVEVEVPEANMGDVVSDINSRKGKIENMESVNDSKKITAKVPLADMFGYATSLRSKTQGRGIYNMTVYGYDKVPKQVFEELVSSKGNK